MRFLGFVVSTNRTWMEEEKIDAIKIWLKLKSIQDIQIFINFANFYQLFIQSFSKIVVLLTSILTTTKSSIISVSRTDNNEIIGSGTKSGNSIGRLDALREKSTKSKSRNLKNGQLDNSDAMKESKFLTSKARKTFNYLKQPFTKVSILQHFDLEYHIQIETDESGYAIKAVLSQLTFNKLISDNSITSKLSIN